MRYKESDRSDGFTLVEVIVVLVILAILSAILIPAFTGYIEKAQEKRVIVETRLCAVAAQTLMSENYGENKTVMPAYSDIQKLAEVKGNIVDVQEVNAVLTHLTYSNYGYTATYCGNPATCGSHAQTYSVMSGGASATGSDSWKAIFNGFPSVNSRMDSLSIGSGRNVTALYDSFDDSVKDFLKDKSWCVYSDGQAELSDQCSSKTRIYFTEQTYSATDNATNVTVYKARLNDDGTLSYQKGTCAIRDGKIYPNSGFSDWGDDWTKL